ncbi:sensor histidine kinase [Burkholderia guangdongensis]|uniref:sensor histidine kinase n=1 Tax=Burkholderia guangdongensis TaxID=1792500 RepID=UPI0015CEC583|nr:sensor histidine kinase [Burkholderia guangdongensis]
MNQVTDRSSLFMSTLAPDARQYKRALTMVMLSAAVFLALAPFAKQQLADVWAFIPVYQTAMMINDLVTAGLLLGQFAILRSTALLVLAGGYLFASTMAAAHTLSFPGLFSATGLLGAGQQSTAWLYMFWHGGFPLAVGGYALLSRDASGARMRAGGPGWPILMCVAGALLATVALTLLATAGGAMLPALMTGNRMLPSVTGVVTAVWLLNLAALGILWRRRPRSVLDLWITVVLVAWLFDIALSSILNHGRFDVGFYAGRIYGLLASSIVLFTLLLENGKLYARTVRALDGERLEHRLVVERTAELNDAKRLLEQRVAARTAQLSASYDELLREIRERQRTQRALEASREELREMSALGASAREEERRRIARELHDELAQSLAKLALDLQWLTERVPQDDAGIALKIASMLRLVTRTVASIRRIAADLRPLMLDDLGFVAATQWLAQDLEHRCGIACTLRFEPPDVDFREPYATSVFRIIQEALANVARHAHAGHVEIDLTCDDARIALRVRDDGIGFDPNGPRNATSFGIVGLRERAYLVNGTMTIVSAPGSGTTIEVDIPLDRQAAAPAWVAARRTDVA